MRNEIRKIIIIAVFIVSGCKHSTTLTMDDLKDGDIYELKEDVFLLPCGGGRLKPAFSTFIPFSTSEWQNATNRNTLKGWSCYVQCVVPQGTLLLIERESKDNHSDIYGRDIYGRFTSGPIQKFERAILGDLISTNSPNNKTSTRYLRKKISVSSADNYRKMGNQDDITN